MDPSARSAGRWKSTALKDLILHKVSENVHIPFIAITETWLKPYINDAQISIPSYNVFRADRQQRIKGGSLLYVHESIPVSEFDVFDDRSCEGVICSSPRKIIFANIYRPPGTSMESFQDLMNFVQKFIDKQCDGSPEHYQIIVTGDLNFPDISWDDLYAGNCPSDTRVSAEYLLNFMSKLLLTQFINVPTRKYNILDVFLTNDSNLVQHVTATPSDISDHNLIDVLSMEFLPSHDDKSNSLSHEDEHINFQNLNYHKADFDKISEDLNSVNWDSLRESVSLEEFPHLFNKTVYNTCAKYTPKWNNRKTTTPDQRIRRSLNRRKYKLRSRLSAIKKFNPQSPKIDALQKEVDTIQEKIKSSILNKIRSDEQAALNEIRNNPKFFYKYAKKFCKSNSQVKMLTKDDGSITSDFQEMSELFQTQFTSVFSDSSSQAKIIPECQQSAYELSSFEFSIDDVISAIDEINISSSCGDAHIPAIVLKNCKEILSYPIKLLWQDSFDEGIIPSFYKEQTIAPIYKKGSKSSAINYRPISLTSHVMKTFERIIRNKLVSYLEENEIICSNQHGFRSGKSCLSQLLNHIDTVLNNGLNGHETDVIYLDFSKAFDKVDHEILVRKMSNCGIKGPLLNWLTDFLSGRFQTVHVNSYKSNRSAVKSGVPQGTVLGPILFLLFINDMSTCLKYSMSGMFADDSRILRKISSVDDTKLLQEDLINISCWSKQNNMELNEDKIQLITHRFQKCSLDDLPFRNEFCEYVTAHGNSIEPLEHVLDLGIEVSSNLSWSKHIAGIVNKARKSLSWALSVFHDRSPYTMMTLYKSFVRSKIENGCPLWHSSKISDIQMLESIQRTFTSRIIGTEKMNYWQRLEKLSLLSLQRRRERFIIFYMWKVIYGKVKNDLHIQFRYSDRRGLVVVIPSIRNINSRIQTLYDDSFAVLGGKLWNLLPAIFSLISCFSTFKVNVDKWLINFPDKPPIQGYPYVNNNSLISL